jgi:hypothetical protein
MSHFKVCCNLIGNIPVFYQVEKIEVNAFGLVFLIQPIFSHTAYATTGAVFENYLWPDRGISDNFF